MNIGVQKDDNFDFNDFVRIVLKYAIFTKEQILRFSFECFDKGNTGTIDEDELDELCRIVNNAHPKFQENYYRAIDAFDVNQDGLIDFNDFINIERDIEYAKDISYNMIANFGIHHCFTIFFEHKEKLIKGCMELDIYSHTMKEIIDYIEKCFDKCLNNTDLELASMYSSFTTATTNNTEDDKSEK